MTSKFYTNQRITKRDTLVDYRVIKTPVTHTDNGRPAYLLKRMNPPGEAISVYPDRVERDWMTWPVFSAAPYRFPIGTSVRHKKSGGVYTIAVGPDKGRLEASDTPAYSYTGVDGLVWHRSQDEMEDGRFEFYVMPSSAI